MKDEYRILMTDNPELLVSGRIALHFGSSWG